MFIVLKDIRGKHYKFPRAALPLLFSNAKEIEFIADYETGEVLYYRNEHNKLIRA